MSVKIYKTSVETVEDVIQLEDDLNNLIGGKGNWNFDLEDCDKILRVDSNLCEQNFMEILNHYGFECKEL